MASTAEKRAALDEEYANFMRELNEAKLEEEEKEDKEEYMGAIKHDIELINEQVCEQHLPS